MIALPGPKLGGTNLAGMIGSLALVGVFAYVAAWALTCHGPCGNMSDDYLYDMRQAACCSPSDFNDCGGVMPGQGSTWMQGICTEQFCNPVLKEYMNGCSKCVPRHRQPLLGWVSHLPRDTFSPSAPPVQSSQDNRQDWQRGLPDFWPHALWRVKRRAGACCRRERGHRGRGPPPPTHFAAQSTGGGLGKGAKRGRACPRGLQSRPSPALW